jgi:hypothetical protein
LIQLLKYNHTFISGERLSRIRKKIQVDHYDIFPDLKRKLMITSGNSTISQRLEAAIPARIPSPVTTKSPEQGNPDIASGMRSNKDG